MEYSTTDLYKMISSLILQKSYFELEQLVLANKQRITITMLNELFELPHESIVQNHPKLYQIILEVSENNKTSFTLRHTLQLTSIKMEIEKWNNANPRE